MVVQGSSGIHALMTCKPTRKSSPTPKQIAMGARIRTERKRKGFTQAQLAAMINVTENAITQFELGNSSPRRERMPALASALGKSIAWLLTGDEPDEEVKAQTVAERDVLKEMREMTPERQEDLLRLARALQRPG